MITIDHEPFDLDAEIGAAMRESVERGPPHKDKAEEAWERFKAAWEAVFKRPYPVARGE